MRSQAVCQQNVSGCCVHQQALQLPFPLPGVLPAHTQKKFMFQRQDILAISFGKKEIIRWRREMPVVHLLRRVPWHVWHGATGRMRIPGVGAPGAASSLLGVNVQARGTWDECDGKRQLEGRSKFLANWAARGIHMKPSSALLWYNKTWHKLVI